MNQDTTFVYKYSARDNEEIRKIRQKYLPKQESKLEELKRLDDTVQSSGIAEALCIGIGGALIFGLGMCLAMEVIGPGGAFIALGIPVGIIGMLGMILAYPVYRRIFKRTKEKLAPRILELTELLSDEINS